MSKAGSTTAPISNATKKDNYTPQAGPPSRPLPPNRRFNPADKFRAKQKYVAQTNDTIRNLELGNDPQSSQNHMKNDPSFGNPIQEKAKSLVDMPTLNQENNACILPPPAKLKTGASKEAQILLSNPSPSNAQPLPPKKEQEFPRNIQSNKPQLPKNLFHAKISEIPNINMTPPVQNTDDAVSQPEVTTPPHSNDMSQFATNPPSNTNSTLPAVIPIVPKGITSGSEVEAPVIAPPVTKEPEIAPPASQEPEIAPPVTKEPEIAAPVSIEPIVSAPEPPKQRPSPPKSKKSIESKNEIAEVPESPPKTSPKKSEKVQAPIENQNQSIIEPPMIPHSNPPFESPSIFATCPNSNPPAIGPPLISGKTNIHQLQHPALLPPTLPGNAFSNSISEDEDISSLPKKKRDSSKDSNDIVPWVQNGIGNADLTKYCEEIYAKRHKSKFSKKEIPLSQLMSFSADLIKKPLLASVPKTLNKDASKIFSDVLIYMHGSTEIAVQIVSLIKQHSELKDEAIFQVLKQINGCPEHGMLLRAWNLLLILVTIFPLNEAALAAVESYMLQFVGAPDKQLAQVVQFALIRLRGRSSQQCILRNLTGRSILEIPDQIRCTSTPFGSSLFEIMWSQAAVLPNCPVPLFLHQLAALLIERLKAPLPTDKMKDLFLACGDASRVNEIVERANSLASQNAEKAASNGKKSVGAPQKEDYVAALNLGEVDLRTLAILMVKWVDDLAEPIIPTDHLLQLGACQTRGTWITFVEENMPPLHGVVLAYLVGFWINVSEFSEQTGMSLRKLSHIFAPVLLKRKHTDYNDFVRELIMNLMRGWDVSDVYPLSEECFAP